MASEPPYKSRNTVQCLIKTETTQLQQETQNDCQPYFVSIPDLAPDELQHLRHTKLVDGFDVCVLYQAHEKYLVSALRAPLKPSFVSLDASRPWIMYWTLHSLDLLGRMPAAHVLQGCVDTCKACFTENQGFGGGPLQMAHGAPSYAAVMVLCIVATTEQPQQDTANIAPATAAMDFLEEIRMPLLKWFTSLQTDCGFSIHHDGERDVRGTYTVVAVAKLLNILTPDLRKGAVEFLVSCQSFEGGFGGEPGSEAHGGYTYCAVAALALLDSLDKCNLPALRQWLVQRQMSYEGGFNGRINKLVDGCYSFWQGAALAIVSEWFSQKLLCHDGMLQRYILLCAQEVQGGLRDKPSKPRDFYHSCYNLSGLSVSQYHGKMEYGHATKSRVARTNACYNIRQERAEAIQRHFSNMSNVVIEEA